MSDRIYVISSLVPDAPKRLVRAASKAQAIGHCARSTFSASLPSQDELFALAGKGVKIETANEESQS